LLEKFEKLTIKGRESPEMLYRLFGAFIGRESGRVCRSCASVIVPRDEFGVSEGVCANCR
jgi:hypothetical protein